jgi:glycosyltransferase involved in cell wall biosynthesis
MPAESSAPGTRANWAWPRAPGRWLREAGALISSSLAHKYYWFGARVCLCTAFTRYDFCQATDIMALFAARGLAARGVKTIVDFNEIPDPFERQGRHFVAAPRAVKRHLAHAAARDLPAAASLIATSGAMADFAAERFGRPVAAIRNARAARAAPPSRAIREDLGAASDAKIIVYPCTAAPHFGVEAGIEMMRFLPANFYLVFVGKFVSLAYREQIDRLIRFHRLQHRVLLKGVLPEDDYLPYLAGADLGLVPLSFTYRNQRLVLPWRMIDLAAARVPVVATANEEILRLKQGHDIGEIAAAADSDALAAAVLRLAEAPAERIAAIKRDLAALSERHSPSTTGAQYSALLAAMPRTTGRAAFICNLALSANRRLIDFIDRACELGWRVDLYSVRGPELALFKHPDRVRRIDIADRPIAAVTIARLRDLARRWRLAAIVRALVFRVSGAGFGLRQILRVLRYRSAIRAATARGGPWDIVIASDIFAFAAGLAAGSANSLLLYDATEIPDLRERTSPWLRAIPAPLRWPFRRWERRYLARAGLTLAPSHALARYLRRRYQTRPAAIATVRNAGRFSRGAILARYRDISLRRLLGLPEDDIVLVSPCGISTETGALTAIRMLRHLPANHVLVFIGRFANRMAEAEVRRALARQHDEHRCFFLGEVEHSLYLRYLADCDIGLVLFDTRIGNLRLAAPNRFFDLVAMELPIVAPPIQDIESVLRRARTGAILRDPRPVAAAAAIGELRDRLVILRGRTISGSARARLRRLARFHSWQTESARLIASLTAKAGALEGKRVALLTLRNAASHRRFLEIGTTLRDAGAALQGFDTDIGAPAPTHAAIPWLTTIALK